MSDIVECRVWKNPEEIGRGVLFASALAKLTLLEKDMVMHRMYDMFYLRYTEESPLVVPVLREKRDEFVSACEANGIRVTC